MLRLNPNGQLKLDEQYSIILNSTLTSSKTLTEKPIKTYNSYENKRIRRDLSSVFSNQDNDFDNPELINLDSVTVNREPNSDKGVAKKMLTIQ